jgi:hypothetical protein
LLIWGPKQRVEDGQQVSLLSHFLSVSLRQFSSQLQIFSLSLEGIICFSRALLTKEKRKKPEKKTLRMTFTYITPSATGEDWGKVRFNFCPCASRLQKTARAEPVLSVQPSLEKRKAATLPVPRILCLSGRRKAVVLSRLAKAAEETFYAMSDAI